MISYRFFSSYQDLSWWRWFQMSLWYKVKYVGKVQCPHCHSEIVVKKDKRERHIRHYNLPHRAMTFLVDSIKHLCRSCKRYFWTRFDGMRPWFRHTETFKWQITHQHHQGVTAVDLSKDFP